QSAGAWPATHSGAAVIVLMPAAKSIPFIRGRERSEIPTAMIPAQLRLKDRFIGLDPVGRHSGSMRCLASREPALGSKQDSHDPSTYGRIALASYRMWGDHVGAIMDRSDGRAASRIARSGRIIGAG